MNRKADTIKRLAATILLGLLVFVGWAVLLVPFPPRWSVTAVNVAGVVVCAFLAFQTYRVLRSSLSWLVAFLSTVILWLVLAVYVRPLLLFLLGIA